LFVKLKARTEVSSITSYYGTHNNSFIARDGHEMFAMVQLAASSEQAKEQNYKVLLPLIVAPPLKISLGGSVPINIAINKQVSADVEHAELITFPIIAVLLLLIFGGLVAASLPLLIGGIAIVGAFAVLHALTFFTDISVFAINIITMLGLGLAIDYALFIVTRFREELAVDNNVEQALQHTLRTAGRTVLFSALTVSTGLLALLLFPQVFLRSMSLGAIAAILVVLVASLTILPAILALLGTRVNALSLQRLFRRHRPSEQAVGKRNSGAWYRFAEAVMRWPVPIVIAVVTILLIFGLPFLNITFATSDIRALPASAPERVVTDHLAQNFVQQGSSQLTIAVQMHGNATSAANLARLDSYVHGIEAIPGVLQVSSLVTVNPTFSLAQYQQLYAQPTSLLAPVAAQYAKEDATRVLVMMRPAEHSKDAEEVVRKVRALKVSEGTIPLVTGITPMQMDLLASLGSVLPRAAAMMVGAIFLLLFLMTGSLLMPLKVIVLNLLSLSATFGGLVWIFQEGHLHSLLNFQPQGSIDATQPILIFAIAFGLSMDYEVFLLSRIKEQFDATGDNRSAVSLGIQQTGWLITSAAALLAVVLAGFGTSEIISVKEIGTGLAIAVIIDATLIRMLLVPATMRLLGRWNWWAPAPLHAIWQRIGLSETEPAVERPVEEERSLEPVAD